MHDTASSQARVSILIRTKNRPLCLKRALTHIAAQTFKKYHVYILNDGGSSQEINGIAEIFNSQLPTPTTVFHNRSPAGRGSAAAYLLENSHEDYVIIHDDDDTLEPTFLEKTVSFLDNPVNQHYVGVVVSNYDVTEEITDKIHEISRTDAFGKRQTPFIDLLNFLSRDTVIIPISLLFKRETLKKTGNVNPKLDYLEDYDLFLRLLVQGDFGSISEPLASYHHRHDTNSSYDSARSITSTDEKHNFYNEKLRQAILEGDETSKFLAMAIMQKRNREQLFTKIDAHNQQITNIMRSIYGQYIITVGKINELEKRLVEKK